MLDLGGTYRAIPAEETLKKIEPLLKHPFGISRVANITGLDETNIPTYIAIRPLSKFLSTSQGKSHDPLLAKVSAIMESIEGWYAENMPPPDLFGSVKDLTHQFPLVPFEDLMNYDITSSQDLYSLKIPWVKGEELNSGKCIYFPYSLINMDMTRKGTDTNYFKSSTNGLASGNTKEEAICHALFEVIERHCSVSQQTSLDTNYIELEQIRVPFIQSLIHRLKETKLHLTVSDYSNELEIPTYKAHLCDGMNYRLVGSYEGYGTHLSSIVALSRAITEAVQCRLTIISGSRDDIYPFLYPHLQQNSLKCVDHQNSNQKTPFIETEFPNDFSACIQYLLNTLKKHGFGQVIIYEHTRKEFNIPVVSILIPKMQMEFNIGHHFYVS